MQYGNKTVLNLMTEITSYKPDFAKPVENNKVLVLLVIYPLQELLLCFLAMASQGVQLYQICVGSVNMSTTTKKNLEKKNLLT